MPVLIVQEQFKDFNIENMVLASEFYGEIYKIFPKMKKIIDLFDTNLHLLKVNTPSRFQRTHDSNKLMQEFGKKFGLKKYTQNIYNDLTIEDGIINFTKLLHADLIAITPDGIWRWENIFNKNITDKLIWRWENIFNKNITDKLMKKSTKAVLSMKTRQPILTPTDIFYEGDYKRYEDKD
jgi:hypothetical protein